MLLFELELLQLQKGVPEGFFFIWLQDSPEPLFPSMDMNRDQEVPLEEVCSLLSALLLAIQYIHSDGSVRIWRKEHESMDHPALSQRFRLLVM